MNTTPLALFPLILFDQNTDWPKPRYELSFCMRAGMEQLVCLLVVRSFDVSYWDLFIHLSIPSHGIPLQD